MGEDILHGSPDISGIVQGFNFRGAWQQNTAYNYYDLVTYAGATWLTTNSFTSTSTFDAANWSMWADSGNSELGYWEGAVTTAVTDTTTTDISGATISFSAPGGAYYVAATVLLSMTKGTATAGNGFGGWAAIFDGSTNVGQANWSTVVPAAGSLSHTVRPHAHITGVTQGTSKTYKLSIKFFTFPTNGTSVGALAAATAPHALWAHRA